LRLFIFLFLFSYSEKDLLYDFHDAIQSQFTDLLMRGFTRSADRDALVIGYIGYTFLDKSPNHLDSKALLFGGILTTLSVYYLKWEIGRERPSGPTGRLNSSFPSGHTAAAFFVSTYLSKRYPKLKTPLFIWSTGVGLSRIYLLRHWPSDVLFGAFLGAFWGVVIHQNLNFLEKE